jgi:arginyl-tRNA synthetase
MNLITSLQSGISDALKNVFQVELDAAQIKIERTIQDYTGDYTFVVFPYVKQCRKSPEITATMLGEYLLQNNKIAAFNVVKGFLNIVLDEKILLDFFKSASNEASYFKNEDGEGKNVVVEYSSPNTNKPLHLGHVRNNLLGYSVSEILKANGYNVTRANLINDRGIHICKSMLAWQQSGLNETPESTGMKGDHLVGKYYVAFDKKYKTEVAELVSQGISQEEAEKLAPSLVRAQEMLRQWEAGDAETMKLWKTMNGWVYKGFDVSYKRLGVDFDKFYYESDTYLLGKKTVQEGLDKNVFYKKEDGSVWIDLTDEGLDNKLLLRSDGTSVYITQDIGTAQLKYDDFNYDISLYVVGNEQDYHFKVLQGILKKLGKPYAKGIIHVSYGMVDLPGGKMKSREGTVVDADDLMEEMHDEARKIILERGKTEGMSADQIEELCEEVGMAALKYYLLRVDPQKRLLFNPSESIDFEGNTGPYIQYTNARINSVIEKAGDTPDSKTYVGLLEPERELILALHNYKITLAKAAEMHNPSEIANYLYDIAKLYNRFYYECPIAKEDTPAETKSFRVALSKLTGKTITECLRLLGIKAPRKM